MQLALNYTPVAAAGLADTATPANVTNSTQTVYKLQSLSRFVGKNRSRSQSAKVAAASS